MRDYPTILRREAPTENALTRVCGFTLSGEQAKEINNLV